MFVQKVKEFEDALASSENRNQILSLEEKLEVLSHELELCHKSYTELEKWKDKLERESQYFFITKVLLPYELCCDTSE